MRLIANILWLIFGGLISAIVWCIAGLLFCITIIGIPLGIQLFKFAKISLAPFGKRVSLQYMAHPIINTLWIVFVGWEMFILYAISSLVCCVTIIGIPLGIQGFKFAKLAFAPFGAKVTAKNQ